MLNNDILNYLNTSSEIFQIGYDSKSPTFQALINDIMAKCRGILHREPTIQDTYKFIIEIMKITLDQFPTTLEDDLNQLNIFEFSFDMKNCLIQRIGEKKVLNYWILYLGDLIELSSIKDKQKRKKFIKKMDKKYQHKNIL
jgi:hypothetical protein